jgi:metallophosphoesterase superfamily enzyme
MDCKDAVLCVGDLHLIWSKKSLVEKILKVIEEKKPGTIIQMGDLYDRFAQSRFARSQGIITPQREADVGRGQAERLWAKITQASPESKRYQLRGNHDARALKLLLEKAPELEPFFDDKDFYRFPGVETIFDEKELLILNGVGYLHGWAKLGDHMKYFLRSVVRAHSHVGGCVSLRIHGKTLWELDCGYLGDPTAIPMRYRPTTVTKWTWGYGWVDSAGPRFIPL